MNSLQIRGDWNITKGKLKEKWANLTADDLLYVDGKMEALVGRVQKRTGATRESIQNIVQGFSSELSNKSNDQTMPLSPK